MIDCNAYLGPFAFRRLRYQNAAALLRLMDAKGISRALVSSAAAITYRNPQPANEDLFHDVREHTGRLVPFAVINPAYAGWQDDLAVCHEQWKMRGIRLYPKWHQYSLSDPQCHELIRQATERKLIISIPVRVEDGRQRSWLIDVPDVPLEEIAPLVQAFPAARFHILNGLRFTASPLGRSGWGTNYQLEISRLSAVLDNEIGQLISSLGADRLVLGTGMPFSYPDPALLKLEVLTASAEVKQRIAVKNAAEWLDA